jgi:hypothetical protein
MGADLHGLRRSGRYPWRQRLCTERAAGEAAPPAARHQVGRTDENCHNSGGPQHGNRWPQRRLPFADDTFDLVRASRAAFAPRKVARILRSGGAVLTLQGNTEWHGETLADALGGTPPDWTLPGFGWDVGDSFRQAGLNIMQWTDYTATVTYTVIWTFSAECCPELLCSVRSGGRVPTTLME